MKEKLIRRLTEELAYSRASAEKTAEDLASSEYPDIIIAAEQWADTGMMLDIIEGSCSAASLIKDGQMTYPAALIFIDWLRTDPVSALRALEIRM